jgi:hypothetical protein
LKPKKNNTNRGDFPPTKKTISIKRPRRKTMSKKKNRKFKKVAMTEAYPPTDLNGSIAEFMVACEMRSIEYGDRIPVETWNEIVEEVESRNS